MGNEIGIWKDDENGLPVFEYVGRLPFTAIDRDGKKVKLPEDPWFLLGNYQLTLFTHVSGETEIISGQRSWSRINAGEKLNSGQNSASIRIDGERTSLCGLNTIASDPSKCSRKFGCGYAVYQYDLGCVTVKRTLAVKPSEKIDGGCPAFLTTVEIINNSGEKKNISYEESVTTHFVEIQCQRLKEDERKITYSYEESLSADKTAAFVRITGMTDDPLLCGDPLMNSCYDGFPPTLYMKSLSDETKLSSENRRISLSKECELGAGETVTLKFITGYFYEYIGNNIPDVVGELDINAGTHTYSKEWKKMLPSLDGEVNPTVRREMIWHAYVLEAMATYSNYYKETKIPQGTIYDYDWGEHASARDNFQHALPLVYCNTGLAKSVLRYMLKRTTPFGEIRLIEYGNGHADNGSYYTSDQQLFFFLLLSEYLRVTKDYSFLLEEVEYYPASGNSKARVIDHVKNCYLFLRDTVNVGAHGLVRLLNSDWNDTLYYILKEPYNHVYHSGESHMNSAMVLSIFQTLIPEIEAGGEKNGILTEIKPLIESMTLYRKKILDAFLKDTEGRTFPKRMYFDGKPYGDENMFLEPMGYTLQVDEIPAEYKKNLYEEMKKRLYKGEKLGARQQEIPEFESEEYDKGSRENGGFWWALNGPVIVGVNSFDTKEAEKLLYDMSFEHYREAFPQYWSSYWSASDNIESSLIPEEGLPDQSFDYAGQPVFCAHPHAWNLYCYYRLHEK